MDTNYCAVDGWADTIPAPSSRGTATFNLIVRPADADTIAPDTPARWSPAPAATRRSPATC